MKRKLVLIVDDEPANIDLLKIYLKGENYNIIAARSGEGALESVKENNEIDLILLDVMMPAMNGYELIAKLKADNETKHIPVALLTSLSDTFNKVTGLEAGCVDYISKTAGQDEIIARVRALLAKKTGGRGPGIES